MGTSDLHVGDYSDCADSDLIIITAGRNGKPGETRLDMASENTRIMKSVVDSIKEYYISGCILIVTNPVDILTPKVTECMQLPNGMVFGSGCTLDTSRFIRSVADYIELSTGVIKGYIVGEHGDNQVPVWSKLVVSGIPIEEYCQELQLEWNDDIRKRIADKMRIMGMEIIKAKGKTHYGIATSVCFIADAIINQRPTIASVSSQLMGKHGVRGCITICSVSYRTWWCTTAHS